MSRAAEDDVDRLIAAWRGERPDMDVAPMQVLSRVTRLALHLDRARKQAFADHDLESSEFDVLSALRRSGKPYQLSPGQLVQETLVTSGTMTNRVDRLVRKGPRRPGASDGVRTRRRRRGNRCAARARARPPRRTQCRRTNQSRQRAPYAVTPLRPLTDRQ